MLNQRASYNVLLCRCLIALSAMMPGWLWAQHPMSITTTSREILIGDQINVQLQYRQLRQPNLHVVWPVLPDSIPGLVWVKQGKIDTLSTKDSLLLQQQLVITGFDSGRYYIPSFAFTVTEGDAAPVVIHTDSLLVQVRTLEVDTTKAFKPIKGVREMPITWMDYVKSIFLDHWKITLFSVLGLLLLAILTFYFLRWRKLKRQRPAAAVPPEKAHERALRLLAELKAKQLWQAGEIKAYYDGLSMILRNYLQNRFQIPAMEYTSDELLKVTHRMNDLKPFRKQLRTIIQTSDLAKFARANPLPEEHERCMSAAEELVRKTQLTTEEGGKQ